MAGITSDKIVYSGVGKKESEISAALDFNIQQFNVESLEELITIDKIANQKNTTANIALRVNPDIIAGGHPKISTGKKTDKFGIPLKEAKKVYAIAKDLKNINAVGVDIHIGSQILNIKPFKKAFNKIIQFTNELEKDGHNIKNIDLGGGIGINYLQEEENSNFLIEYTSLIKEVFKKTNKKIFIEPGRFLIANSGLFLAISPLLLPTSFCHNNKGAFLIELPCVSPIIFQLSARYTAPFLLLSLPSIFGWTNVSNIISLSPYFSSHRFAPTSLSSFKDIVPTFSIPLSGAKQNL